MQRIDQDKATRLDAYQETVKLLEEKGYLNHEKSEEITKYFSDSLGWDDLHTQEIVSRSQPMTRIPIMLFIIIGVLIVLFSLFLLLFKHNSSVSEITIAKSQTDYVSQSSFTETQIVEELTNALNQNNIMKNDPSDQQNEISTSEIDWNTKQIGDIVFFGDYEWYIVEKSDKNCKLLCRNIVTTKCYGYMYPPYWEDSTIREWLNSDFYRLFRHDCGLKSAKKPINTSQSWC